MISYQGFVQGFALGASVACLLAGPPHLQDVQRNLEPKNRDKFTQNLTIVRHEFRSKV